jgi:uncharacterized protein (TIGR02246 family)
MTLRRGRYWPVWINDSAGLSLFQFAIARKAARNVHASHQLNIEPQRAHTCVSADRHLRAARSGIPSNTKSEETHMTLEQHPRSSRTHRAHHHPDEVRHIEQCLGRWQQAMQHKDAAAAAACYSEDAVLFNLAPPLRQCGMQRQALQAWFDTWQTGPTYEMREVQLMAGEDIAYCSSLTHMTGTKTAGEETDLWFRATVCLRKLDGEWRITHEHTSVPFLMDGSFKAAVNLRPTDR